jgi:hypothetical protein
MRRSQLLTLIAVFATLSIICDAVIGIPQLASGVWYGWIFLMEPIAGIILGPYAGFVSTLIGVLAGHSLYLRGDAPMYEYLFTLGAPLGTMICGFVFRGKLKIVLLYYTLLLATYFLTPIARNLPLWGMWNVYVAYSLLCVLILMRSRWNIGNSALENQPYVYALCAFLGLEADILFRIFLLIPGQTYQFFYGFTTEVLSLIWVTGALVTPIQVGIAVLLSAFLGPILVKILSLRGWFPFEKKS